MPYFSIMGKKEKRHKRSHTSKKKKLRASKSRSRHKSKSRPKARPDSSDSFSTSDTSSTSSSDYEHQQFRHCKRDGTNSLSAKTRILGGCTQSRGPEKPFPYETLSIGEYKNV